MKKPQKFFNKNKDCPCKEVLEAAAIILIAPDGKMIDVYNKDCPEHGMRDLTPVDETEEVLEIE